MNELQFATWWAVFFCHYRGWYTDSYRRPATRVQRLKCRFMMPFIKCKAGLAFVVERAGRSG